jgi:hypothetical protein
MNNNNKKYSGWAGVKNLAKDLNYSWEEVCELLWKRRHSQKTTFRQILMCACIRYELELIKAGHKLKNYDNGKEVSQKKKEQDIHYIIRTNIGYYRNYLKEFSTINLSNQSNIYIAIRDMYAKKSKLFSKEIDKQFKMILPTPQSVA